jgi:hypothetical protein
MAAWEKGAAACVEPPEWTDGDRPWLDTRATLWACQKVVLEVLLG